MTSLPLLDNARSTHTNLISSLSSLPAKQHYVLLPEQKHREAHGLFLRQRPRLSSKQDFLHDLIDLSRNPHSGREAVSGISDRKDTVAWHLGEVIHLEQTRRNHISLHQSYCSLK